MGGAGKDHSGHTVRTVLLGRAVVTLSGHGLGVRRATPPQQSAGGPQPQDGGQSDVVGDVAQRDAPLDVAEGGGERVVAHARGDCPVGPRRCRRAAGAAECERRGSGLQQRSAEGGRKVLLFYCTFHHSQLGGNSRAVAICVRLREL